MAKNQTPTVPLAPDQLNDAVLKALESPLTIIPSRFRINLEEETIYKTLVFFFENELKVRDIEMGEEDVMYQALKKTAHFLQMECGDSGLYVASEGRSKTAILKAIKDALRYFKYLVDREGGGIFPAGVNERGFNILTLSPMDFVDPFLSAEKIGQGKAADTILFIDDFLQIEGTKEEVARGQSIVKRLLKERVDNNLPTFVSGSTALWDDNKWFSFTRIFARGYYLLDLDWLRSDEGKEEQVNE